MGIFQKLQNRHWGTRIATKLLELQNYWNCRKKRNEKRKKKLKRQNFVALHKFV
jgi:hypothetical protein